jgi:hypothetical protein
MAFLTILGSRQLVATHGNGFGLYSPISGARHLPAVATSCDRFAPQTLHPELSALATSGSAIRR